MIYADPSFLFSLYAEDQNSPRADALYGGDKRRPLIFTPWQRFELRNTVRLAAYRSKRAGQGFSFAAGQVFKNLDEDLKTGILRHHEPDWRETFRLADELSAQYTDSLGVGAVDVWHVAAGILLRADSFWTFDEAQAAMARKCGSFKVVRP